MTQAPSLKPWTAGPWWLDDASCFINDQPAPGAPGSVSGDAEAFQECARLHVLVEETQSDLEDAQAALRLALQAAYDAVNACGGTYTAEEKASGYADGHGEALDAALAAITKLIEASQ